MWRHHTAVLTLLLTRHGHTDRSDPDRYTGQRIDAHLTERGMAGARALGERLATVVIDRVVSSPLDRAVQTARLIRPDGTMETDDRLMEADYGDWEGYPTDEVDERWPDLRERWEADPATVAYPNGETGLQVAARVGSFMADLRAWDAAAGEPAQERRVLAVGHATTNRILLAVALGVPIRDFRRRFRQDWVNLTVLRFSASDPTGAQLVLANDLAHVNGTSGVSWPS
jgi:broad specificity phosphatase PhoE